MPRLLSTKEAAEALGLTEGRVRQLCQEGRVKGAQKVGDTWVIEPDKDGRPKVTLRPPGRPRKE